MQAAESERTLVFLCLQVKNMAEDELEEVGVSL